MTTSNTETKTPKTRLRINELAAHQDNLQDLSDAEAQAVTGGAIVIEDRNGHGPRAAAVAPNFSWGRGVNAIVVEDRK